MTMSRAHLWIGTSWKMNKTLAEAVAFANALRQEDEACGPQIQRFVIPPFTTVRDVAAILSDTSVKTGVQNIHWQDKGAWTGEISGPMAKDCGAQLVELGHSERRAHFGETNETVGLKVAAAVRHGLTPLICVGESQQDRESGKAQEVLETQVRSALAQIDQGLGQTMQILLAYEPVWAIGDKGIPATPEYADARQAEISAVAYDVLGRKICGLYGGSVSPENCQAFISCPNIDGLFIGRSAWDVAGYLDILRRCEAVTTGSVL